MKRNHVAAILWMLVAQNAMAVDFTADLTETIAKECPLPFTMQGILRDQGKGEEFEQLEELRRFDTAAYQEKVNELIATYQASLTSLADTKQPVVFSDLVYEGSWDRDKLLHTVKLDENDNLSCGDLTRPRNFHICRNARDPEFQIQLPWSVDFNLSGAEAAQVFTRFRAPGGSRGAPNARYKVEVEATFVSCGRHREARERYYQQVCEAVSDERQRGACMGANPYAIVLLQDDSVVLVGGRAYQDIVKPHSNAAAAWFGSPYRMAVPLNDRGGIGSLHGLFWAIHRFTVFNPDGSVYLEARLPARSVRYRAHQFN